MFRADSSVESPRPGALGAPDEISAPSRRSPAATSPPRPDLGLDDCLINAELALCESPDTSGPEEAVQILEGVPEVPHASASQWVGLVTAVAGQLLRNAHRALANLSAHHQAPIPGGAADELWGRCARLVSMAGPPGPATEHYWINAAQDLVAPPPRAGGPDHAELARCPVDTVSLWSGLPTLPSALDAIYEASLACGRDLWRDALRGGKRWEKDEVYVGQWRLAAKERLPLLFAFTASFRGDEVGADTLAGLRRSMWDTRALRDSTTLFSCVVELFQLPDFHVVLRRGGLAGGDEAGEEEAACTRAAGVLREAAQDHDSGLAVPLAMFLEAALPLALDKGGATGPGGAFRDERLRRVAAVVSRTGCEADAAVALAALAGTRKREVAAQLALVRGLFRARGQEPLALTLATLLTTESDCSNLMRQLAAAALGEVLRDKQGRPRHARAGFQQRGLLGDEGVPGGAWESEELREAVADRVLAAGLFDPAPLVRRTVIELLLPHLAEPPGSRLERRVLDFLFLKARDSDFRCRALATKQLLTRFPVESTLVPALRPEDWRSLFQLAFTRHPGDIYPEKASVEEALAEYLEPFPEEGLSLERLEVVQDALARLGWDQDRLRCLLSARARPPRA